MIHIKRLTHFAIVRKCKKLPTILIRTKTVSLLSNNRKCHLSLLRWKRKKKKRIALKDYNELIHSVIWSSLLIPHSWTSDVLNWQYSSNPKLDYVRAPPGKSRIEEWKKIWKKFLQWYNSVFYIKLALKYKTYLSTTYLDTRQPESKAEY